MRNCGWGYALLALALLAGCVRPLSGETPFVQPTLERLTASPVFTASPSATLSPRPSWTPQPPTATVTLTAKPTATVTPTPLLPVALNTPLPQPVERLSAENYNRITRFAFWGQGAYRTLAVSRQGELLAVGSAQGIVIYNIATQVERQRIVTPASVQALSFAPDGSLLAAALEDNTVQIWQVNIEKPWLRASLSGHHYGVTAVAFSPLVDEEEGYLLATGDVDSVRLWQISLTHGGGLVEPSLIRTFKGQKYHIWSLAFSVDGNLLASGGGDGTIYIISLPLNATSRVLVGHKGAVYGLAFAPDDRTLASAGEDGTLRLWRAPKWEPIAQWTGHNGQAVNGVLFSPKGDYLISSGDDGNLRLWKLAPAGVWQGLLGVSNRGVAPTTVQEFALGGRGRGLAFASLSEDRQYLAAGSPDAPVLVWEVTSEGETWQLTQSGSLEGFLSSISSLALSLDGGLFATGSFLAVQTRRTGDGSLTATLYGPTNWVSSLAFSPAGGVLAGGSGDGKVWLFAVKGGQVTLAQTLTEHTGWVRAVAFSPVENLLASASQDRTVKLWRTTGVRAEELYSLGASSPMLSLAFAPDGMLLAGGTVDGQVLFWQTASGKQVNALQGTSGIYAMIFLPGGEYLVTGAEDGMITLWNLKQELQAARLNPGGGIWALSVSPVGDLLAAAYGEDGKVALYDIRDPKNPLLLKDLNGHSSEVSGVAFSRDGLWLVTAAEDGTVVFWGVGN